MDADHVELAASEMRQALTPLENADWTAPAGSLRWSCLATAAHIGHDLIAYATQLTARATDDYLPLDLVVRPEATPAQTLRIVSAATTLLAATLRTTPAEARAWHWGPTDPSGFAALGVNEILNHTYDIATGLGLPWKPPAHLSALVVARLFPDAPAIPTPATAAPASAAPATALPATALPATAPPTMAAPGAGELGADGLAAGAPSAVAAGNRSPFTDAPNAVEPGDVLLWCTGRQSLPGHPRQTSWQLKAALA